MLPSIPNSYKRGMRDSRLRPIAIATHESERAQHI